MNDRQSAERRVGQLLRVALSVLVAAVLLLASTPARASGDRSDPVEFDLEHVVVAAMAGNATKAQIAWLIAKHPTVADRTPAPDVEDDITELALTQDELSRASCKEVWGTRTKRSITGAVVLYKYTHKVQFCWLGGAVTSAATTSAYFTNVDFSVDIVTTNHNSWKSGVGTPTAYVFRQGRVNHIIPDVGGIVGHTYPWVKLKVTGAGNATYTQGE